MYAFDHASGCRRQFFLRRIYAFGPSPGISLRNIPAMKNLVILLFAFSTVYLGSAILQIHISGKVVDAQTGDPLVGVSVAVKGTKLGTVTDLDGKFTLANVPDEATLVITYTGYAAQEVAVKGKSFLTILLQPALALDEIVVTATDRKRSKLNPASLDQAGAYQMLFGQPTKVPPVWSPPSHESYAYVDENTFRSVTASPTSTFAVDVDRASYSNIRRFLSRGQRPPVDAVRVEEMINYFDYDYSLPDGTHPLSVHSEITDCPWNREHKLVQIGLQGKTIETSHLPASNLVFLIDVSGSMSSEDKLPMVKSSLHLLIEQLRPQDRVAIVTYAGTSGVALPSTSGEERAVIRRAVDRLSAGGSTAGAQGIVTAYDVATENFIEGGNNRVILATDGDFNVGVQSDGNLRRLIEGKRKSGVFLSILGYGTGNYKDSKMQTLAAHGNGNHAYIDNMAEARKVLVHEFGGSLFTIAKDVKIQVEFNPAKVAGYRLIGYENRLLNQEDFRNDQKDAGEIGAGHQVTALYEIIPAGTESDFLPAVDVLKYQREVAPQTQRSDEWMEVNVRYKLPDAGTSIAMAHPVTDVARSSGSANIRWASAVAAYGMILRASEYAGTADVPMVLSLARGAVGTDPHGYRSEFVQMVEGMRLVAGR